MSYDLTTAKDGAVRRVGAEGNHMTFPRELRAAIPDLPTCVGRVLEMTAVDVQAKPGRTRQHVRLRFEVRETGKLDGVFAVLADLDPDAALALADAIRNAVQERTS